MEDEGYLVRD